jgi:hypothetical protein
LTQEVKFGARATGTEIQHLAQEALDVHRRHKTIENSAEGGIGEYQSRLRVDMATGKRISSFDSNYDSQQINQAKMGSQAKGQ